MAKCAVTGFILINIITNTAAPIPAISIKGACQFIAFANCNPIGNPST